MRRAATLCCTAAILLAFAPWGTVSIRILGVWSPGLDVKGTEIGSGVVSGIAAGWVVVVLALICATASRGSSAARRVAALMLLGFVVYSVLTLSHHSLSVTGSGQDVSSLVGARVTVAWGAVAELVVAGLLVVSSLRRNEPDVYAEEYEIVVSD